MAQNSESGGFHDTPGEERVFMCLISVSTDGGAVAQWHMDVPLSDKGTEIAFRAQGVCVL